MLSLCGCATTEDKATADHSIQWPVSLGEEKEIGQNPTEAYLSGYASGLEVGMEVGAAAFGTAWRVPREFYPYQEEWIKGINEGMVFVYNTRHPDRRIDLSQLDVQPDDADNPVNTPEIPKNQSTD